MIKTNLLSNATYEEPRFEVIEVATEKGFADSDPITWGDEEEF